MGDFPLRARFHCYIIAILVFNISLRTFFNVVSKGITSPAVGDTKSCSL